MATDANRIKLLKDLLAERIAVLDGAFGTFILSHELSAADYGGAQFEGCNENVVRSRPDLIREMHAGFLEAGADIIETASFGSTRVVLAEYGLERHARELNRLAAEIACEQAVRYSTPSKPRFVAGSMGPTTKSIMVTGGITFDAMADAYQEQAEGLIEGGVDLLILETVQDTLNCKAGLIGIDRAIARTGVSVGVAVSGTIETMGTLLGGQDIEAFYVSLAHRDLLWMGLNCATGPEFMTDHLRTLSQIARCRVACVPNAGLPDEEGRYNESPTSLAAKVARFARNGWVNVVGGCCGTTFEHIRLLADAVAGMKPRVAAATARSVVSGLEVQTIDADTRPVIVGERTNVLGSRKFKRLIAEDKFEEASEIGRAQVRRGAHILDVCLQDPDRDELPDVVRFLELEIKKVKAPLMIDSTDQRVVEEALKRTPGKSIINSINLEDGEHAERFQAVIKLARQYGAAVVVGCIDEDKQQAQAITRERKLAIAERSYRLLTEKYAIEPEDIIFDPLTFPIATGDKNYVGAGVELIEGIRLIKAAMPRAKTILGISNVSFGLPPAGREVLNAVMLHHCVEAGLDLAMVNTQALPRYGAIPEDERLLADDLIWWRGADPIAAYAAHFRERKSAAVVEDRNSIPLDERLARYILEGSKDGLHADLDEAMRASKPMEIINGPLMKGMDEVGRLFNQNQMIVAEVLQSAEAMKAAVGYLEPHMEKAESAARGSIILATVKGDVHDIGKNLVEIILSNNGYRVINLGIKVPPDDLIKAYREHSPDLIGLSGLLVKSAQMMVVTAQDFKTAGIDCPLLVGGAALSNRFTRMKIAPEYDGVVAYANDAMTGLDLANQLMNFERRESLTRALAQDTRTMLASAPKARESAPAHAKSDVRRDVEIPTPPDLKLHVIRNFDLTQIFKYINPAMLYARHLGFKNFEQALAAGDAKARELHERIEEVTADILTRTDIAASAIYKFFPANSDGDRTVTLYSPDGARAIDNFRFGRMSAAPYLSLADYVSPREGRRTDYLCMFLTTIGTGVRAIAEEWKARGDYLRSHIIQVLALEGAEAFAELLHQRIRAMWAIGDPPNISMKELFQARYRGKRYSPGYPACPRLEDQEKFFRLLEVGASSIPVTLTEGWMMDPESSVTAIVFHHPECKYFNLAPADIERLEREFDDEAKAAASSIRPAANA
jgi:5-methyltetrahydrofolate--homocysteine methyltransferase